MSPQKPEPPAIVVITEGRTVSKEQQAAIVRAKRRARVLLKGRIKAISLADAPIALNARNIKYPWKTTHSITYQTAQSGLELLEVPAGVMFDGASIPSRVWSILWFLGLLSPFDANVTYAACFHDRAYTTHEISRIEADSVFAAMLMECHERKWLVWIIFAAVRLFGGGEKHWKRCRDRVAKVR